MLVILWSRFGRTLYALSCRASGRIYAYQRVLDFGWHLYGKLSLFLLKRLAPFPFPPSIFVQWIEEDRETRADRYALGDFRVLEDFILDTLGKRE